MRRSPGGAAQPPRDERPRQPDPDGEAGQRDSRPADAETEEAAGDRTDDRVVVARGSRLHVFPVEFWMLLVEECVVFALTLLAQTHPPGRRSQRVDDDGILGGDERLAPLDK